jgi:hypothetical protein
MTKIERLPTVPGEFASLPLRLMFVLLIGAAMSAVVLLTGCGNDATGGGGPDAAVDPDPLAITDTPPAGSLDDIHQRIIAKRCSGQPGLCHNGQFEPNLSTPALTYAYLVNRPGLEHANELRVKPGDPSTSLVIDKLRNRNVATQMPLGAEPLEEADIAAIESWITAGALRSPGAQPAPVLNNPPKRPEIAIFNGTTRLDGTGPVHVNAGTTLTLRHTVADFETPDANIPFAAVVLSIGDGRNVVLNPSNAQSPQLGMTSYDAAGPMGKGDQLDFKMTWQIPSTLPLYDPNTKAMSSIAASGQSVTVLVVYVDQTTMGIATFDSSATPIQIQ